MPLANWVSRSNVHHGMRSRPSPRTSCGLDTSSMRGERRVGNAAVYSADSIAERFRLLSPLSASEQSPGPGAAAIAVPETSCRHLRRECASRRSRIPAASSSRRSSSSSGDLLSLTTGTTRAPRSARIVITFSRNTFARNVRADRAVEIGEQSRRDAGSIRYTMTWCFHGGLQFSIEAWLPLRFWAPTH